MGCAEEVDGDVDHGEQEVPAVLRETGVCSTSSGYEVLFVIADGDFSRVGPVVVGWHELIVQVYLFVEVVSEDLGDFIVTAQIAGPEVVIKKYLVCFLKPAEYFLGLPGFNWYTMDIIGIDVVED